MGDNLDAKYQHNGVLFVGSIPFNSAEDVFSKTCSAMPGRLYCIPDGETGERSNYIAWQRTRFPQECLLEAIGGTPLPETIPTYTIDDVKPTRYDDVAIESYAKFVELRKQGIIPSDVRFQICLPSPYNNVIGHLKHEVQPQFEPLYEKRLEDSIQRIAEMLPHDDIVIQWDLCFEMISLEYECGRMTNPWFKPYFPGSIHDGLLKRVIQVCNIVAPDIRMAFHLCHGDMGHRHFVEPADTSLPVKFANEIIAALAITHRIEWIHMPVPRDRTDAAYFEPLNKLNLHGAGLYLGLVHANDEEGTRQRIATAKATYPHPFGVATECGLGRTPKDEIDSIFAIAKKVTPGPLN